MPKPRRADCDARKQRGAAARHWRGWADSTGASCVGPREQLAAFAAVFGTGGARATSKRSPAVASQPMATMADGEALEPVPGNTTPGTGYLLGLSAATLVGRALRRLWEGRQTRGVPSILTDHRPLSASRNDQRCTGRLNATQPEVLPSALVTYVHWAVLAREEQHPARMAARG